ncbi:Uncharacterised protein [Streptococcus suis]|nr:Uncharacterised protein [Streptococcus suis]CYV47146.1 Uncharacterised protein [Streptococcus suis]
MFSTRNGSRYDELSNRLTSSKVEKMSFSTLNRRTPILINGAEASIYETTVTMANCLIVSLVLRLKKMSFSTLERRNYGRGSEGKLLLRDFPNPVRNERQ